MDRKKADKIYASFCMHKEIGLFTIEELEATLNIYRKDSHTPFYQAVKERLARLKKKKEDEEKHERTIVRILIIVIVGGILGGIFMDVFFP